MKHVLQLLTLVLVVSVLTFAQGTTITLLHVNDTHSHLDAFGPKDANLNGTLGGIARAATVIGTVKATEPNVLLLHAGDLFQGDPFFNTYFGVPEFQLMLQLGFDAMAVGNHEFGYGPGLLNDVLTTAFAGGSFPLLSANLDMSGFPDLKKWIQPSMMKTVGGVKIGIFGMTVPGDPTTFPAPVTISDNVVQIATQQTAMLRDSGATVVIFLSHLGSYLDKIVAANVAGIDFIIGGHDHYLFAQPIPITNPAGKQTLLFQAGDHYAHIGKLHFTVDNGTVKVDDYTMLTVDSSVPAEPTIQGIVDQLKQGIVAQFGDLYGTQVAVATHDLNKASDPASPLRDTPLGNIVTDAFRAKTGTDLGFTANGLISEKIYAGPIVGADVFRSMSYGLDPATGLGFKMATFSMRGEDLRVGLEVSLSQLEIGDDFSPQVSGMTFKYDPKRPIGHRVIDGSIKIGGKPCVPVRTYTVTSNSGLPMLLQTLGVPISDLHELPDFEFTVVMDYIQQLGIVSTIAEGRILDNSIHPAKAVADTRRLTAVCSSYPNPFNPTTTIAFHLPQNGFVHLDIFNSLGQEIAQVASGEMLAGDHAVTWDAGSAGKGLSSGIYFYRLQAGDIIETHKIILMK